MQIIYRRVTILLPIIGNSINCIIVQYIHKLVCLVEFMSIKILRSTNYAHNLQTCQDTTTNLHKIVCLV